jgi:hypothetical protein
MTPAQPALDAMMEGVTALLENVTPGPWAWDGDPVKGANLFGLAGQAVISYAGYEGMWFSVYDAETDAANARFIAAARELVPALAAEVRALQHDNDALREAANAEAQENETQRETIAGLTARVEALTAEKDQLEQDLSDMRDNAESAYRRGYWAGGNGA